MNLKNVTGKYLEEKLKRGYRLPYFVKALSTTEEDLFEHIDKHFSSKAAQSFKHRIKSKEPIKKNGKKKAKKAKKQEVDILVENSVQIEEVSEETILDQLLVKEEQLSAQVCQDEAVHSQMISKRAVLKNQLIKQRKEMQKIAEKALQLQQEFEDTVLQWNSLGEQMRELSASIAEKKSSLKEYRDEIDSLKKISMYFYSNGEIEFENQGDFDPSIDFSRVDEIIAFLIDNEDAEGLTVRSIKILAKALAIVEKMNAEHQKFEVTFEDSNIQEVFPLFS